jgi:predicted transcriptional regulator
MIKRGKLEIIKDILSIIKKDSNRIKQTPLLRKSNLSSARFKGYYSELVGKGFIKKVADKNGETFICLSEKGFKFLEKYRTIIDFIEEFEL